MPPGGTDFSARRAFKTGSGQSNPVASSVVAGSVVEPPPVSAAITSPRNTAPDAFGFSEARPERQRAQLPGA